MPESFDGMLAELADAAASATPLPDVAAVRRRARERTVHRRLVASALAVVVLGACGGTVAAVQAGRSATASVGTLDTPPGTGETPTPSPASAASSAAQSVAAARSSAAEAAKEPFAQLVGLWQLADGGSELVVFPDGVIGMGKTGDWELCDGRLAATGDGTDFKVAVLACGDDGTTGLTLQLQSGAGELTLDVRSGPDVTLMYQRTVKSAEVPTAASFAAAGIKLLMGGWTSRTGDGRGFTVLPNGLVSFNALDEAKGGSAVAFTGTITGYYADAARVEIPCLKPVDGLKYCGVMELEYDTNATATTVVGSDGTEDFTRLDTGVTGTSSGPTSSATTTPSEAATRSATP